MAAAATTAATTVVDGAAGGLSFNYKALDKTLIDTMQLAEIVSLDEDKEHTFSRDIVEKWFQQAEETLPTLKEHFENRKLSDLSKLAHYFKGSSGSIGASRVKEVCERLKCYGDLKLPESKVSITEAEAIAAIPKELASLESLYKATKVQLKQFYARKA